MVSMINAKQAWAWRRTTWITAFLIVGVVGAAVATRRLWLPKARELIPGRLDRRRDAPVDPPPQHGRVPDPPTHAGHDETRALQLSELAWKNIGLTTGVVELRTHVKTVSVPAIVVERPGRSQVEITAPLTGIVTRVHPLEGEAIQPGQPLFDLRLTHEDLVTAQRDFLRSAQDLDIAEQEIARLEALDEGIIAGRRVLEKQYEQQKIAAAFHAQRQGLLLHGLTDEQIDEILSTRRLLQDLTVSAPPFAEDVDHQPTQHLYHVQKIDVLRGQHVTVGTPLGMLADHCLLYVEGQAFEDDAQRLTQSARDGRPISVLSLADGSADAPELQLKIMFVADHVDQTSRALKFYLLLPNQLVRDERQSDHRFVAWKYRPGQRMEVRIPVGEPWVNQIILPPEAIVEDGADCFVFEQNGDHFDRLPVHIIYRDKEAVVVENDGALIGSTLAMSGAYLMHLAIKNKAGTAVDPHAGHNH